jgi:hypothetical protein
MVDIEQGFHDVCANAPPLGVARRGSLAQGFEPVRMTACQNLLVVTN